MGTGKVIAIIGGSLLLLGGIGTGAYFMLKQSSGSQNAQAEKQAYARKLAEYNRKKLAYAQAQAQSSKSQKGAKVKGFFGKVGKGIGNWAKSEQGQDMIKNIGKNKSGSAFSGDCVDGMLNR